MEELELNTEIEQRPITNLPFQEAEDDDDEVVSAPLETYSDVKLEPGKIYVNPETGERVNANTLSIFEKLKMIGEELGQTIDNPDKSCKKCYGRGYTGFNADGNIPVPCNCIYKTFFKNNPHWKGQGLPSANRKARRFYEKRDQTINKSRAKILEQIQKKRDETVEKSKANLGKNTPGYIPKSLREEVVTEVVAEVEGKEENGE